MKTREKINQIKYAIRNKFAWPGGYELFGITKDGDFLCVDCMKNNLKTVLYDTKNLLRGWEIEGIECAVNLEKEDYVLGLETREDAYYLTTCCNCEKILNP